ncbi:MAG: YidC/Oxa1 family insertase periplasmic-domain containing protein [Prevotella sp.]|nr:YidC/Oxa1 family insertase periplasmic-domain containing protein [Prevotella sp.]
MKRTITLLMATVWMGCATLFAANQNIKELEESKYLIEVGDLSMVVNAATGGKILSFKYKDQEVISQLNRPEQFGSTFWTSPQKEWNWPPVQEYDKRPYKAELKDDKLVLTSEVSSRLGFRIGKEFTVDAKRKAIVVTYSIKNESNQTKKVAPWEITRVANEGQIFFDAPVEGITPAGLMTFEKKDGAVWYQTDEANANRKINADGKGWLAYTNGSLLLVKKFKDLDISQPAPEEAEIQVYVNRGKTYIELESQGAYATLEPGQSLVWPVKWYLLPCDGMAAKKMVKKVKKLK